MAPLEPHWQQPSHPDIQEVRINAREYTSKSLSRIALPPFGLYAKLAFPPCTLADAPTYATVQFARARHLSLNSDLLYINHSCEPSLTSLYRSRPSLSHKPTLTSPRIFDTANLNILAGPNGLLPGQELTFFYPSTEWDMAQSFSCLCGHPTCRGRISGAKDMTDAQLRGLWINGHILELRAEQDQKKQAAARGGHATADNSTTTTTTTCENGSALVNGKAADDATAQALKAAIAHAEDIVASARLALDSYLGTSSSTTTGGGAGGRATPSRGDQSGGPPATTHAAASSRRGPTSRQLGGEMGGDTTTVTAA